MRTPTTMRGNLACCCVGVLIGFAIVGAFFGVFVVKRAATPEFTELKQLHVIFSHGERTPSIDEIKVFPLNVIQNETYYPYGLNALTNEGKMTMFETGEMLRKRYDKFMTKIYNQEDSFMQTTNADISKMSALLVLAGLWPTEAEQKWSSFNWQPIPYKNLELDKDYMLYEMNCPRYKEEKDIATDIHHQNALLPYRDLFRRLSVFTGSNISSPTQVLHLSNLLISQDHMKLSNPKWLKKDMVKSLRDVVKLEYNIKFHSLSMQRLSAGTVLYKILTDLDEQIEKHKRSEKGMKLQMYSGYLNNVAAILAATGVQNPHPPKFGSAVMVELHYRPAQNDYAIKVLTWNNNMATAHLLRVPHCDILCPIEEFRKQVSDILVADYESECKLDNN